jgi:hypothetical protein
MRALRVPLLVILAVALAVPAGAAAKRKPPPPPPPPPDSAADCSFVVFPAIDDYIVLASLVAGVRCETVKQRIDVTTQLTRDGVDLPMLPVGANTPTCTKMSSCFVTFDLFSYDNHPVAFPGNQVHCARGSGVVGGQVVGPGFGCESDERI